MTAGTDGELRESAEKIKIMYDDYNSLLPERFEFTEKHEKVSDGVYKTVYSNGTIVVVDYNKETFEIIR